MSDEHQCLSFLYHHTKLLLPSSKQRALASANLLSQCLRFNFLNTYNILSALRKNESLHLSLVFKDAVDSEFKTRVKGSVDDPDREIYAKGHRLYFDRSLVLTHGRARVNGTGGDPRIALCDEVIQWAYNSKSEMIVVKAQ